MKRLILILAALTATTALPAVAATTVPLSKRLLTAGELAGYTPTSTKTLQLDGYAHAVGLEPKAKSQLASAGFIAAAVETLQGPTPIPARVGASQSSVLQFGTSAQATSFLRWIKHAYGSTPLKGIHRSALPVPGLRNAWNVHYWSRRPGQRLDECNATFAIGAYLYEIDIFSRNGALTPATAAASIAAYATRLPQR